jgi:hypothetical protein
MSSDDDMPELEEIFIGIFIEADFWEPVKIGLSEKQIKTFITMHHQTECYICTKNVKITRQVPCCKQIMCQTCTKKWFGSSVKCPFCVQDIREKIPTQ